MQLNRVASYSQSSGRVSAGSDQHDEGFAQPMDEDVAASVPVYVMLPLDTVNADGIFRYASANWFSSALKELKQR